MALEAMPPPRSPYDRRLVGILLTELERRGHPFYPQEAWQRCLRKADYETQVTAVAGI